MTTQELMEQQIAEMYRMMKGYASAFPENDDDTPDFAGHRKYHDSAIAAERKRKEFWEKMMFELVKWGLIGFLGWFLVTVAVPSIVTALVTAVKGHP